MSKKFQNDLKLGLKSENTSIPLLERIFGEIIKTDRYNKYDFKCLHKPIKIELKTRRCDFGDYPDLQFELGKIEDGINADFPDLLKGKKFELKTLNYNDLDNPLVSIAMARLWLAAQGATSTYNNPTDAYWLYKNVYNTNLKLDTKDKFIKYYNE